jgi:hypothetical protein
MKSMSWRHKIVAPAIALLAATGGSVAVVAAASSSASGVTSVTTEAEFRTAWASDATVTLGANITLTCQEGDTTAPHNGTSEAVRDLAGAGTLDGQGFTITQTCPESRVLQITGATGAMTIENVTITGGQAVWDTKSGNGGGGIQDTTESPLTVVNSTISNNLTCEGGGAIEMDYSGDLTVSGSTFNGNTATSGNVTNYGGLVKITNSTITGNTSIYDAGGIWSEGALELAYSDVVGNTIDPTLVIPVCAANLGSTSKAATDPHEHSGPHSSQGDPANILAESSFTAFGNVVTGPVGGENCGADTTTTSQGYNWSDDTSCGFTDATDKVATPNDPKLNALGAWGGPTQTMLPLTPRFGGSTSPLIDAIPVAACQTGIAAGVTTDQRGVTRPQLVGCDIGAVEVTQDDLQVAAQEVVLPPKFTG